MCSKPVVNTIARVTSGVLTLGTSEIARNNLSSGNIINKTLQTPGNIVTAGQGGNGLVTAGVDVVKGALGLNPPAPPPPPPPPPDPTDTTGTDPQPIPGGPAPGLTTIDSLARRRKRLAALQGGITSTVATGPGGATGTPSLISPTAGGLKLKLGA